MSPKVMKPGRIGSIVGVSGLLAGLVVLAGPVSAQAESANRYCVTTVDRLTPGSSEATVIDESCGVDKQAAEAKRPMALKANRNVLLAQLFQNAKWSGWRADLVAASACDSAGYGFSDVRRFNSRVNGISSYRLFNNCDGSAVFKETHFNNICGRAHFARDVEVPLYCNDHVYSMRMYKSY